MIIAIDFDGTVVDHRWPEIGPEAPGAVAKLTEFLERGHSLILYTMRSGSQLEAAIQWFRDRGIPLYGVNHNPTQDRWTSSPKAYAQLYIDDAAYGCPMIEIPDFHNPVVDWSKIVL